MGSILPRILENSASPQAIDRPGSATQHATQYDNAPIKEDRGVVLNHCG